MTPAWVLAGVHWLATAAGLYLAILAWKHPSRVARELAGMALLAAEWSLAAGVEMLATEYAQRLLWSQIAYIGTYGSIAFLFRFWVKWLHPDVSEKWLHLVWIMPAIMVIGAFTNPHHTLIWTSVTPSAEHPALWVYGHGPLFWLGVGYSYLLIAGGLSMIVAEIPRRRGVYRRQLVIMLAGVLVPIMANLVYLTGLLPEMPLEPTPIALTFSMVVFLVGVNVTHLLDLVPAARSRVIAMMPDGVLVIDDSSRIIDWNKAALEFCGAGGRQLMGADVREVFGQWSPLWPGSERDVGAAVRRFVTTVTPPGGTRHVLQVTVAPLRVSGTGGGTIVLLHDMTELADVQERLRSANERLERLNSELHRQAIHDPLTGFYNRYHMDDALVHEVERARRYGQPLGLLVVDMDHFKPINDTYGHTVGDVVLKRAAEAIQAEVRAVDVICRFGGDEFVVVMPGSNQEQSQSVAKRLQERIRNLEVDCQGTSIHTTLSIGLAVFPEDGADARALFHAADAALLAAKDSGRDKWVSAS
jgi:diguanylate cyclase (GGDEF)-like protein/PAS domain S-box-containing protein